MSSRPSYKSSGFGVDAVFLEGGEQELLGRDVEKGSGSIKDADKVPRDMTRWRTFGMRNGGKEGRGNRARPRSIDSSRSVNRNR
jgi:hypothetical protein